jgi:hypothetical protein
MQLNRSLLLCRKTAWLIGIFLGGEAVRQMRKRFWFPQAENYTSDSVPLAKAYRAIDRLAV